LSRSSLFMVEKPRNRMERDLDCMADVLMGFHWSTFKAFLVFKCFKVRFWQAGNSFLVHTRVYPKVSGLAALERELQMIQLSATRCSCISILWVSLVSFAATTLCVASQRVFIVISLSTQSGNFWIHLRIVITVSIYSHHTLSLCACGKFASCLCTVNSCKLSSCTCARKVGRIPDRRRYTALCRHLPRDSPYSLLHSYSFVLILQIRKRVVQF
jgi:hypothetical protein